jgi:hypothetical protein
MGGINLYLPKSRKLKCHEIEITIEQFNKSEAKIATLFLGQLTDFFARVITIVRYFLV